MTGLQKDHNAPKAEAALRLTADESAARKQRAALLSILSNAALVLLKVVVGFWGGSVSVLSDAAHSATDLLASGIAYIAVRVSDTPPDEQHPYGHGKIESVSGLIEAILIFSAAGFIIYEAAQKLHERHHDVHGRLNWGLVVMAVSACVSFFVSRRLSNVARQTESQALEADASHVRTDVITSIGVFIGLALARFTPYKWFDPLTALIVALFIARCAYRLTADALHLLLDARLPVEEEAAIQEVLETHPEVMGYHKLRTRKSGSQRHMDVHVQIEDESTLVQAHALTEELEDQIRNVLPAINVNIHIEPYRAEMQHQQEAHGSSNSHGGERR